MSFYLKPPKGQVNLHVLVECVQQRISCYQNLQNDIDIRHMDKFEYLVEDSILDRTGHFIFRLGVLSGSLPRKVFLDNELSLFNRRLICFDKGDMEHFLKKIIRQLKDCIRSNIEEQLSHFYWKLYHVCSVMSEKGYLCHIFRKHSRGCDSENVPCNKDMGILVPFWYCNNLVAARKVDMQHGNVVFECHQWREILPALYVSYLKMVLNNMKYSRNVANTLADDRISGCLKVMGDHYPRSHSVSDGLIRLKDIEKESVYFPLCMKNLYDKLRTNHRLAHNDRFDLSLFLKSIGLSLNDSIKFWEGEYTKQHSLSSKCSHSWHDNERKYVYGIRHLYGLEGSRKNYSVRSCNYLQDAGVGINCEGGCPFVHHDDDHLRSSLKQNLGGFEDEIEVMIFERKEDPALSCKLYSECISKRLEHFLLPEKMIFENPVQYYKGISNRKSEPP